MNEFQSAKNRKDNNNYDGSHITVLKPLDQTILTILSILICAMLSWIAYNTHENSVSLSQVNASVTYMKEEFQALHSSDMETNKRIDNLENILNEISQNKYRNK